MGTAMLKLLVVDDEQTLLNQIKTFFSTYPNLETFKANTGEEAMDIINKENPDIILLDLRLGGYPAMDGMAILEKLHETHNKAEVIIMTAVRDEGVTAQAKKLGARAYLKKPFPTNILQAEVNQIILEKTEKRA